MPLTAELSPAFAARYPEIANISDILASEQLSIWDAKRTEIYRVLNAYYLASADATNPMIVKDQEHHH